MKQKQMYGLFEKVDGKWVRMFPNSKFPKQSAIKIFQSSLLASALGHCTNERRIRPVK